MGFRFYLTINTDLTRRLLAQSEKEKIEFEQLLIKAAMEYLKANDLADKAVKGFLKAKK